MESRRETPTQEWVVEVAPPPTWGERALVTIHAPCPIPHAQKLRSVGGVFDISQRDRTDKIMFFSNSLENKLRRWNDIIRNQPQDPKAYIQRGMVHFKLVKIDESIQDFDMAEQLDVRLKPYLWQRGLSYYYAERFAEGAQQFEIDLTVNAQDVEETVWRYLCIARLSGVTEARNSLLIVKNDPRRVMRHVYDLYAENCTPDDILTVGQLEGNSGKFYSHLYLGLYYEAQNKIEKASEYIVKAVDKYKIDDYMWNLAQVHKILRGWS